MKIGIADTVPLNDPEVYQRIYDSLPGIRQAKADSLKVMSAKYQSVAAGWLMVQCVGDLAQGNVCVSMAEQGIRRDSDREKTIYYNLSHSGEMAACIVAGFPVGIDVEVVKKCRMSVAGKCFNKQECFLLEQAEDETKRAEFFTKFWTKKESASKLTGEGLSRICSRKNLEETDEICTVSERLQKGTDIYYLTVAFYKEDSIKLPDQILPIRRIGYENV